ncbi:hypothetical protein RD792_016267 [Penstemon davidsonii]|uniref:Non-haem dioxygenase N-terminal domain-containing protein n=1 Tax=Penstemon davidsonii TaxID=160366 RepID=A0ABR0CJN8_9LAMI|nr:hypothetical protein RD792_016267 [Penstemon davidsonii]
MAEFNPDFIQPLEHRPKLEILESEDIPLLDLSPLNSPQPETQTLALARLVADIGNACENWGFFQVINHGVPSKIRDKIELASRKFFAMSKEEKMKLNRDEKNIFGYSDMEITKNVRDWKEVFDCTIENPTIIYASDEPDDKEVRELINQWPEYPPELRQV